MVTHDLWGLKLHCERALILHNQTILEFDDLQEAIDIHKRLLSDPSINLNDDQSLFFVIALDLQSWLVILFCEMTEVRLFCDVYEVSFLVLGSLSMRAFAFEFL